MGYVYICCVCAGTYRRGGWKPQEEEEEEEVVIYVTAHARVEKSSFLFRPLFHYTFFRWPCCLSFLFIFIIFRSIKASNYIANSVLLKTFEI